MTIIFKPKDDKEYSLLWSAIGKEFTYSIIRLTFLSQDNNELPEIKGTESSRGIDFYKNLTPDYDLSYSKQFMEDITLKNIHIMESMEELIDKLKDVYPEMYVKLIINSPRVSAGNN